MQTGPHSPCCAFIWHPAILTADNTPELAGSCSPRQPQSCVLESLRPRPSTRVPRPQEGRVLKIFGALGCTKALCQAGDGHVPTLSLTRGAATCLYGPFLTCELGAQPAGTPDPRGHAQEVCFQGGGGWAGPLEASGTMSLSRSIAARSWPVGNAGLTPGPGQVWTCVLGAQHPEELAWYPDTPESNRPRLSWKATRGRPPRDPPSPEAQLPPTGSGHQALSGCSQQGQSRARPPPPATAAGIAPRKTARATVGKPPRRVGVHACFVWRWGPQAPTVQPRGAPWGRGAAPVAICVDADPSPQPALAWPPGMSEAAHPGMRDT